MNPERKKSTISTSGKLRLRRPQTTERDRDGLGSSLSANGKPFLKFIGFGMLRHVVGARGRGGAG